MNKRSGAKPNQRGLEYKDFRFRRRYDHFLRFKLKGAKPQEIINTARELGFNLTIKDLRGKRKKSTPQKPKITAFNRLKNIFGFNS